MSVRKLYEHFEKEFGLEIFSLQDEFTKQDIDLWLPCVPKVFPIMGLSSFGYSKAFKLAFKQINSDLLHIHGLWMYPQLSAGRQAIRKQFPLIVSPRGMLDSWALKNSFWKKRVVSWLWQNEILKYASCIHALCESEYNSIRAYGLTNPVAIIPNGIDSQDNERKYLPPWGKHLIPAKKILLFIGRIHHKKGMENLIKAWSKVRYSDWCLVIAGWNQGGHEQYLKKIVADQKLKSDIFFIGPVFGDKKIACLQNADAFILPSFSEGLPMSVLEAWSYNLPVIMTKECNIPEGFLNKAAIEIQPNPNSIAKILKEFFALPEDERKRIGQNGFQLVKQKFTWPKIAEQMINVYKWCLGLSDTPHCIKLD